MLSNTEKQRNFKARMYADGFKQKNIWIKQKDGKGETTLSMKQFILKLRKLTTDWNEKSLSSLLHLFIKIAAAKKEVTKHKKRK